MTVNQNKFMDEFWEEYSMFHDAKLNRFSVDSSSRALNLELILPVYKPDGHVEKYLQCMFAFENINYISITSEKPTYGSSSYAFPADTTVDSFSVDAYETNGNGLGDLYTLRGTYGWAMEFLATGFIRTVADIQQPDASGGK